MGKYISLPPLIQMRYPPLSPNVARKFPKVFFQGYQSLNVITFHSYLVSIIIYIITYMDVFWNRGTSSHHPFWIRIFPKNHPELGVPPMETSSFSACSAPSRFWSSSVAWWFFLLSMGVSSSSWGYPTMAGFISWKIPSRNGWWLGVPPWLRKPRYLSLDSVGCRWLGHIEPR